MLIEIFKNKLHLTKAWYRGNCSVFIIASAVTELLVGITTVHIPHTKRGYTLLIIDSSVIFYSPITNYHLYISIFIIYITFGLLVCDVWADKEGEVTVPNNDHVIKSRFNTKVIMVKNSVLQDASIKQTTCLANNISS